MFPVNSAIQFATATTALGTILLLWRFRKATEVKFLIYLEICVAIWATCYALEFNTSEMSLKILFSQFSYFGIAFIPVCYFFFTTTFCRKNKPVKQRNLLISLIIPVLTLVLVFTNAKHFLIWKNLELNSVRNILHYEYGTWFWIFYTYTFLLIGWGLLNLLSTTSKFTSYYKRQITVIIIGSVIPVIANVIYISKLNPFPGFDWTTVSFVITGVIIAYGIFKYNIFKLIPLAQKKLLNTMSDGILVVNNQGIIEDINPATLSIFKLEDRAKYARVKEVFNEYPPIVKLISEKTDGLSTIDLQLNGKVLHYQIKTTGIYNKYKELTGKLLVIHDVSTIRQAEIELKQKNKQLQEEIQKNEKLIDDLDSYAHTLAHDLKNSLGLIYSSSDIILGAVDEGDMDAVEEFSKVVKESSSHTIKVTNELLKMATAGHQDVESEQVDMTNSVDYAIKRLADVINEHKAQILIEKELVDALAYGSWINEVWMNLINNAIKYGGTPPVITIGYTPLEHQMIKYWIKDNGDGIAPEQHQKIFRKHTRLLPDKAKGYGLGLSIVKRIIEKLGGDVGVESPGIQGQGSLFYFTLPKK